VPEGFRGIRPVKPPPPPPPKFVPPALGAAIAVGAFFGWELGKKLSGNTGRVVGEEEEQAAIRRAKKAQLAEIKANNQRNRGRGDVTLPTQTSQYLVRITCERRRWTVDGAGNRGTVVVDWTPEDVSPQDLIVFGRPETAFAESFVSGGKTYFNGRGTVRVSRSDGSTFDYSINGGGTIYEFRSVAIALILKLPENTPITFPYPTPTQTRPPRPIPPPVVEPYRTDEPKRKTPLPPLIIKFPQPQDPTRIETGRTWLPDGSFIDWTRRIDGRTGELISEDNRYSPNPITLVPPIRTPEPTRRPTPDPIITPQRPKTPPPIIIPVPVPIPVPIGVPIIVPSPDRAPFPQRSPAIAPQPQPLINPQPIPREVVPPARETQAPVVPERDIRITIPIAPQPPNECDPCIQRLEDKLDDLICDREDSEGVPMLFVEISTPPTITKATWNENGSDTVYIAGYFVFQRDGYDLAPEIPVRRLFSAHIVPREANGYRLYPTNGAELSARIELIELPLQVTGDPPCRA